MMLFPGFLIRVPPKEGKSDFHRFNKKSVIEARQAMKVGPETTIAETITTHKTSITSVRLYFQVFISMSRAVARGGPQGP
jgi:hypothetical protein